jgi:hypothetical protein
VLQAGRNEGGRRTRRTLTERARALTTSSGPLEVLLRLRVVTAIWSSHCSPLSVAASSRIARASSSRWLWRTVRLLAARAS